MQPIGHWAHLSRLTMDRLWMVSGQLEAPGLGSDRDRSEGFEAQSYPFRQ